MKLPNKTNKYFLFDCLNKIYSKYNRGNYIMSIEIASFDKFEHIGNNVRLYYSLDDYRVIYHINLSKINNVQNCNVDSYIFMLGLNVFPYIFGQYYPNVLVIKAGKLSSMDLETWEKWYLKILASFFQKNKLEPTIVLTNKTSKKEFKVSNKSFEDTILLLNDGTINSCVATEILKRSKLYFELVSINPNKNQNEIADITNIKVNHLITSHLESHVPKEIQTYPSDIDTSIFTPSIMCIVAGIKQYKYTLVPYERTPITQTTMIKEFSKHIQFERKFNTYVKLHLNHNLQYSSVLQPLYSLQIAKIFASNEKYHQVILDSNRCNKCARNFLLLYPFLGEKKLLTYGINYLNEPPYLKYYLELTGIPDVNKIYSKELQGNQSLYPEQIYMLAILMSNKKNSHTPFVVNHFIKNVTELCKVRPYSLNFFSDYSEDTTISPTLGPKIRTGILKIRQEKIETFNFNLNFNINFKHMFNYTMKDVIVLIIMLIVGIVCYKYKNLI